MRKILIFLTLFIIVTAPVHGQDAASDLLARINSLRTSLGLAPYTYNSILAVAAQNQAQYMVDTGSISHTQANGSTPSSRAAAAGYPSSFVSENIYGGTNATTNDAWSFWMNSPIHYRGITNPGYTEIGIGAASSSWGHAFVLVFGSQANPYVPQTNSQGGGGRGGNDAASQGPPPFIVGQDSFGNIMHEIQPGQTLGDIALIYGYTWEDIPYMLQINSLTQDDVRKLKEGAVFLVPPHSGTFTPTPLPEGWPTPTPYVEPTVDNSAAVWTAIAEQGLFTTVTLTPTPSPTITPMILATQESSAPTETAPDSTAASAHVATSNAVPAFLMITVTPQTVAAMATNAVPPAQVIVVRDNTSQWVIAAVILQSLLIAGASIEFIRRSRKK